MIQLLGEGANDIDAALLRELFLQRLPTNVQMVLAAAAPLDLAGLAGLADAVMEVSAPSVIIAADTTTQSAGDASNTAQDIRTPQTSQGYVHELCQRLVGAQHLVEQTTTALTETAHHVSATTTAVSVQAHVAASVLARGQKTDH